LGATLYCLLTGRPPFQAATTMDTLVQVMEQEPLSPRQLNPAIPRDLATICLKCLRKERNKRYATAADLAKDLGRWLENKPIVARPVGHAETVWLWCKRQPTMAAAIAVTAVAIVGGGIAITAIQGATAVQRAETKKAAAEGQAKTAVDAHVSAAAVGIPTPWRT